MTDTEPTAELTAKTEVETTSSKKAPKKRSTARKSKLEHPKYNEMITEAIKELKERGGSSRQAILKYILRHFDVGDDPKVVNVHLKMGLRRGVATNALKHSKGQGASGSFLIAVSESGGGSVFVRSRRSRKVVLNKPKSSVGKMVKKPKSAVDKPIAKTPKKSASAAPTVSKTVKPKVAKIKKPKSPRKTGKVKKPVKSSAMKRKSAVPKKSKPANVRVWLRKGEKLLPSGEIGFSPSTKTRKSANFPVGKIVLSAKANSRKSTAKK